MSRIIVDAWHKQREFPTDDKDPNWAAFGRRAKASNEMFGWLYEQGILKEKSFEFRDYPTAAWFAVDTADLVEHRDAMLASGVENAELATRYIFDEQITPCMYSGVIQLTDPMNTYRDVDGCVGRSWECTMVQNLNVDVIDRIAEVQRTAGDKEAATKMFDSMKWNDGMLDKKSVTEQRTAEAKSVQYKNIRQRMGKTPGLNQVDAPMADASKQYD